MGLGSSNFIKTFNAWVGKALKPISGQPSALGEFSFKRHRLVENSVVYHFPKVNFLDGFIAGAEVFLSDFIDGLVNWHRDVYAVG